MLGAGSAIVSVVELFAILLISWGGMQIMVLSLCIEFEVMVVYNKEIF